ncbi:hypothetical protein LO772_19415 [Yinghuangia sp. ASG 101]|uniref:hypothetical protein n=1 Tax=Yinghuangia sp. ASG 101 TaxID=2896848 RepID=UPI001E60A8BB|nr:hypothetical protein [Yinghuangia sp. ASG 101]UGQ09127.1 hypothetical protein LO772_19415 [Yinghuangia sp. ASG 101]
MSRYAAAKPYAVPERLEDLAGPTAGFVMLPRHIDWGPSYEYDLADEADAAVMYERVIREAAHSSDVVAFLDEATLRRLWPRLVVPAEVRMLWERHFPALAASASAA